MNLLILFTSQQKKSKLIVNDWNRTFQKRWTYRLHPEIGTGKSNNTYITDFQTILPFL